MEEVRSRRLQLPFADGLRALAALAVVVNHAYTASGRSGDAERDLPAAVELVKLGQFAVPVFIVLSGFVLMLPVAAAPGLALRGGLAGFARRRARRLLPPYYASLLLCLLLIALVPQLGQERGTSWDSRIPVTGGGLLSHLLVVHNLSQDWRLQINGPAWSVGTEWQVYWLLPPLLLPLWRRSGPVAACGAALALGWGLHWALPGLDDAHPWLVADFALGAAAAAAVVRGRQARWLGPATAAGAAASAWVFVTDMPLVRRETWVSEVALGVVVAMLLAWLGHRSAQGRPSALHAVLERRPLVAVGLWSYSLYLVHSPVISLGNVLLLGVDLTTAERFALQLCLWVPLALATAYAFHVVVERRFLTSHQRLVDASAPARPVGERARQEERSAA